MRLVRFNYSTQVGVAIAWGSVHRWKAWLDYVGLPGAKDPANSSTVATSISTWDKTLIGGAWSYSMMSVCPTSPTNASRATASFVAFRTSTHGGRFIPRRRIDDPSLDEGVGSARSAFHPDSGYVSDPQLAATNLGVHLRFNDEVVAIARTGKNWTISTDRGELSTAFVVDAAGLWSGALNAMAGVGRDFNVRTRPLRQEVHAAARVTAGDSTILPVVSDLDPGTYIPGRSRPLRA